MSHKYTKIETAWEEWMTAVPAMKAPAHEEHAIFLSGAISAMFILQNGVDFESARSDINTAWLALQRETGFKK